MDFWFPHLMLFCGLYLQLALFPAGAARRFARMHPLGSRPGNLRRVDRMSWVLITAGTLWGLQNLLV